MPQRDKEPRLQGAATTWKREDIRRDLQEGSRTGDFEANSRIFSQDAENERQDIVEGPASSEMEKKPIRNSSVRGAGNVGAPAALGNFATTGWKKRETRSNLQEGETSHADTSKRREP
jgi:hypothetical protein